MLHFTGRIAEANHLRSEISNLMSLAESCSRQIRAWADSLPNSPIKGQRHLNDQSRAVFEADRRAEAFQARLAADYQKTVDRWVEQTRAGGDQSISSTCRSQPRERMRAL